MPHVSSRQIEPATQKQIEEALEIVLAKLNKSEMNTVLLSLLTDTERLMVAKRLAAVVMLEQGLKDSDIASVLKLTRMTINKFDKARDDSAGFQIALKKLQGEKTTREFIALLSGIEGKQVKNLRKAKV